MTVLDDVGALEAVSAVFGSLGRILLCLDAGFRVLHASSGLGDVTGKPIADLLGVELFGEGGTLRQALLAGERREGWRAFLRGRDGLQLLSLSAAPFVYHSMIGGCEGFRFLDGICFEEWRLYED